MNNVGPGPEQRGKRSYVIPCTKKILVTPTHVGGSEQRQACNAAETGDGLLVILSSPPSPLLILPQACSAQALSKRFLLVQQLFLAS